MFIKHFILKSCISLFLSHHLTIVYVMLLHLLFLYFFFSFFFCIFLVQGGTFMVMDLIFYVTFTSKWSFIFPGEALFIQEFHAAEDLRTFNIALPFPPNWRVWLLCLATSIFMHFCSLSWCFCSNQSLFPRKVKGNS